MSIKEKKNRLSSFSNILKSLIILVARNANFVHLKYISFPFVVIEPAYYQNTQLLIKMQSDLMKTELYSNRNIKIYGDLEIIGEIPSLVKNEHSDDEN